MSWSIDEAARVMGMPAHEIVAVAESGDYHVVSTHDGQHTVVTADGTFALVSEKTTTEELAKQLGVNVEEVEANLDLAEGQAAEDEIPPPGGEGDDTDPDLEAVPEVDAKELIAWVGDDKDRAARALEVEKVRDKGARSTVVAALEKVASA